MKKEKKIRYEMKSPDARLTACKAHEGEDKTHVVEGYLAVFDNLDFQGDVIRKGAFKKTIGDKFPTPGIPLLVLHAAHGGDTMETIGTIFEAREDDFGLFVKARIASTEDAQRAFTLIAEGHVRGLSIGYKAIRWAFFEGDDENTCCELLEIALLEGTVTGFPANEKASITGFKSEAEEIKSRLDKIEETLSAKKGRTDKEAADTDDDTLSPEGKTDSAASTPSDAHLQLLNNLNAHIQRATTVIERNKANGNGTAGNHCKHGGESG